MCVSIKKPYSTLAEYGYTLYSKLSTLFECATLRQSRYCEAYATSTLQNGRLSAREPLTINPYTCRLTILNTEAGLLTYSAWSAFPIFSVADTPNTYPRKDRNLQQQVLFRILTEFPFHPLCQTLWGTVCVAKIVNNSFRTIFLYIFLKKTI